MADKPYMTHETALVATDDIGAGTRIWAFCNIQTGVSIGDDVNVGDHCFIESGVVIGDRVTIKNGVSLWDGVKIEDDVFVGPHAVFTNDVYPRSKAYNDQPARTDIRKGATIGANATIIAGHSIGRYAFVGAGAVVTADVPDHTLWLGNPARCAGYVDRSGQRMEFEKQPDGQQMARGSDGEPYALVNDKVVASEE
jgi:acetyltransferase-like isoleucine patch superfamily enzyme